MSADAPPPPKPVPYLNGASPSDSSSGKLPTVEQALRALREQARKAREAAASVDSVMTPVEGVRILPGAARDSRVLRRLRELRQTCERDAEDVPEDSTPTPLPG